MFLFNVVDGKATMLPTLEPDLLLTFIAIAETGSFTAAARRVHRTQSAVSMQIKRLEEGLGRSLFEREGRSVSLTPHGEILLDHARRIIRAHREALAAFDAQAMHGDVRVGSPDDYASTFLPGILARFAQTHPKVHVEVFCKSSTELLGLLEAGEVDLALVTQGSGETGGTLVHREPLVWVTSAHHCIHEENPLPLAVFEQGCIFRRYATEALARCGRQVRIAYTSVSLAGIHAALDAGLACSAELRSNVRPGLRMLTEAEGFPRLPEIGVTLQRSPYATGRLIDRLEQHMLDAFSTGPAFALAA
jgi:DNA-binding transcriptional LysR family regulator